jgi:hypothetical protein
MHKLTIVFERIVNKGFPDMEDKVSTKGKLVKGTPGEHTEEWKCAVCDKLGWPVAGHSIEYFMKKIAEGAKPIRIEGEGPFPESWSDDQKKQIQAVLAAIKPQVDTYAQLKRMTDEHAERLAETKGSGKSKRESESALSA